MKKKIYFAIILVFNLIRLQAQDIQTRYNDILYVTPTTSSFHKMNFLPSNLYTGKIDVNIPIYDIKDGDIHIPISLSYDASGVKIDHEASSVGLGWNLNAGGSVIRTVKDIEDHKLTTGITTETGVSDYDEAGYPILRPTGAYITSKGFWREYSEMKNMYDPKVYGYKGYETSEYCHEDSSPDQFIVAAPSLKTTFIINGKHNNSLYIPSELNQDGNIIDPLSHSYINLNKDLNGYVGFKYINATDSWGVIWDWELLTNNKIFRDYGKISIKNPKGIQYIFDSYDISETMPILENDMDDPSCNYACKRKILGTLQKQYSIKKSAWHLDEMVDLATNKKVKFSYTTQKSKKIRIKDTNWEEMLLSGNVLKNTENITCQCRGEYFTTYRLSDSSQSSATRYKNPVSQKLKSIEWDGGIVKFEYNLTRKDVEDDKALTDIIILDSSNKEIKRYQLTYKYFYSTPYDSTPEANRLVLNRIIEKSTNDSFVRYSFDYDESHPLPKVYSEAQDYLGFFNNRDTKKKVPTMYFSANKGEYSIIPFQLDESYVKINEGYSLLPNTYSLLGLLKKITFPTGGSIDFTYENHIYNLLGKDIVAGGARIKRQVIDDGQGIKRILDYSYTTETGESSGRINNLPRFGSFSTVDFEQWSTYAKRLYLFLFTQNMAEIELTHGAFVGYSRIIEKEKGNGYKKYEYTNSEKYPNTREVILNPSFCDKLLQNNSLYPASSHINNDIQRGKLLTETTYDENNNMLVQKKYKYDHKLFNKKLFKSKYLIYRGNMTEMPGMKQTSSDHINIQSEINVERNLKSSIETLEYAAQGIISNKILYSYDIKYPFIKEVKNLFNTTEINSVKFYYPNDLGNYTDNRLKLTSSILSSINRVNNPIVEETFKNSTKVSSSIAIFENNKNGLIHPYQHISKIGLSNFEDITTFENYDTYGNPLHIRSNDVEEVIHLWSYKGQYSIGEIRNATYTEVSDAVKKVFGVSSIQALSSQAIPNEAKLMDGSLQKELPHAMITTYTYKPLVGITSITEPSSRTIYYQYDKYQRLRETYYYENNERTKKRTIKQYEYNFKK